MTAIETLTNAHVQLATTVSAARLLADSDDDLGAGFIAFMVVVVLGVACYFLFRSMSRHLGNVPASFDEPTDDEVDKR